MLNKNLPILRLLLSALMLYFALPRIPLAISTLELTFWALWIGFFLLVVGANLANLLQMIQPPVMEQSTDQKKVRARR